MIKFIVLYWMEPSIDFSMPDQVFGDFDSVLEAEKFGDVDLPDDGEYMVVPKVEAISSADLDHMDETIDRLSKGMDRMNESLGIKA